MVGFFLWLGIRYFRKTERTFADSLFTCTTEQKSALWVIPAFLQMPVARHISWEVMLSLSA